MRVPSFAAVDVGAESGRVVVGRLQDGRVRLTEVHRFANRPVPLPDGLRWDVAHAFGEIVRGLRRAGAVDGVGIDTWGVDYGLLDGDGRLLGLPFHHRDARVGPMRQRAFERVPAADLYARTGIQSLPINTVFQLLADEGSPMLAAAERLALMPDLLGYWLCGELACERTIASTTGLLDARSGEWAVELVARLGLPGRILGRLVDAGTALGTALTEHGLGALPVRTTASHDTAAAFAAAPVGERAAILSSGTWSLLGLELPAPVVSEEARAADLSNERGVEGTTRLLRNVMGLWLVQECRRHWGVGYDELQRLAAGASSDVPLFDPDDEAFLSPGDAPHASAAEASGDGGRFVGEASGTTGTGAGGRSAGDAPGSTGAGAGDAGDMPSRIAAACRAGGQDAPSTPGALVRSVLVSLACKYRLVLDRLERVSGREVELVHVVGGGARNELLCRLTADLLGRPVLAGPVEATALGNVLVQARGHGELESLDELRAVAAASAEPVEYEPGPDRDAADATYDRFLDVTRAAAPAGA